MRLTDNEVRKLKTEKSQIDIADDICRGLKLRVTRDGRKSWALVTWNGPAQKTIRKTLGVFPEMTTADARRAADAARVILATVAPEIEVKPEPAALTFNGLADEFIERYAKRQKHSWKQDELNLKRPRAAWGSRPAASIERREVIALLDGIAATAPVSANRIKSLLNKMFDWSVGRDLIPLNPIEAWREAPGGPETAKDRALSDDEVRAAWKGFTGTMAHAVARAVLLTAQRPGECANVDISELDLEAGLWIIPAAKAKNRTVHAVPLTWQAVDYFRSRIGDRTSGPVFPGRGGNTPMTRHAVTRNCGVEGVEHFSPHDLRRTAATGARRMGASVSDIGSLLNHTETGITAQVYALSDRMDEKKRARDALEKWLAEVLQN